MADKYCQKCGQIIDIDALWWKHPCRYIKPGYYHKRCFPWGDYAKIEHKPRLESAQLRQLDFLDKLGLEAGGGYTVLPELVSR